MNFRPHKSVEIYRQKNGFIADDRESFEYFWGRVEDDLEEGISGAIGCYIFSIRAGKGILPWYVGLAEKQSFRKECFTSHKLLHYNKAIRDRKGTPVLTLIAKYSPTGKLISPTGNRHRDVQFLETLLIASCLRRNPGLYNTRDTKLLREMIVPGLLNTQQGGSSQSVSEFRTIIGK